MLRLLEDDRLRKRRQAFLVDCHNYKVSYTPVWNPAMPVSKGPPMSEEISYLIDYIN